jgi:BirA family biotin operon repressor/biotin-[acetyl-CoA-carboxylase] ligase
VGSTTQAALDLARQGAPAGSVVLANLPLAGQGRRGKRWFSPRDVNLYCSVILRPPIATELAPFFTFIASVALADTLDGWGVRPGIKWPNDLLVGKKKIAGVLADALTTGHRVEAVILGVGVNLNVSHAALAAALGPEAQSAISLREVVGAEVDRTEFAIRFLQRLAEWYDRFLEQGKAAIMKAWMDWDLVTGRRVIVRENGHAMEGTARGVDEHGYLIVETLPGETVRVISGEVRLPDHP